MQQEASAEHIGTTVVNNMADWCGAENLKKGRDYFPD